MNEPSSDDCHSNAEVDVNGERGFAAWYPTMGGYVSRCVIVPPTDEPGCYEVYVWHDGDFPFSDGGNPRHLHHCDPDQFIRFGELLNRLADITLPPA